ncbi:hypothetical protein SAMN05518670_2282 [Paenibacillus sp. OK076]|nr:hypothetical protein SAMN05518670_2282 [Paenibacillus sp. OK076]
MLRHGGILFFHDFMDNEIRCMLAYQLMFTATTAFTAFTASIAFIQFLIASIILYKITTFSLTVSQRHGVSSPSPI